MTKSSPIVQAPNDPALWGKQGLHPEGERKGFSPLRQRALPARPELSPRLGYSTWATTYDTDLDEIRAKDFNLNISRYVDTTKDEEVMSVEEALTQLHEAERRRDEAVAKTNRLLAELGYA